MLRTRPSCILHRSTIDTTVVYTYTTVMYMVHRTVMPRYYGHDRRVRSTDARRSQDGDIHQPNYYQ